MFRAREKLTSLTRLRRLRLFLGFFLGTRTSFGTEIEREAFVESGIELCRMLVRFCLFQCVQNRVKVGGKE